MKVPPRVSFAAQVIGGLWLCFVQVGVKSFLFRAVPDICAPDQANSLTCPSASTYFSSSIVWGAIGPRRLFSQGSPYAPLYWALLVGAIAPLPFWYASRRLQVQSLKFVCFPLIFSGSMYIPPASGLNYTAFFFVAFIFRE